MKTQRQNQYQRIQDPVLSVDKETKNYYEKGLSLVEIIIVVALIELLAAIGTFTWANAVAIRSDTQRKNDLAVIQNALQKYYANTLSYPTSLTFGGTLADGIQTYNIPGDPKTDWRQYCYEPAGIPVYQKYILYAKLERNSSGTVPYTCGVFSDYNYQVASP